MTFRVIEVCCKLVLSITGQAYTPLLCLKAFIMKANSYFNSHESEKQGSEPDSNECGSTAQPAKQQPTLHVALAAPDLILPSTDAACLAKQLGMFLMCRNGHTAMNDLHVLPNLTMPYQDTMDQEAGEKSCEKYLELM